MLLLLLRLPQVATGCHNFKFTMSRVLAAEQHGTRLVSAQCGQASNWIAWSWNWFAYCIFIVEFMVRHWRLLHATSLNSCGFICQLNQFAAFLYFFYQLFHPLQWLATFSIFPHAILFPASRSSLCVFSFMRQTPGLLACVPNAFMKISCSKRRHQAEIADSFSDMLLQWQFILSVECSCCALAVILFCCWH